MSKQNNTPDGSKSTLAATTFTSGSEVLTSSLIIANESDNSHEAVIKLVRKYHDDFQEFGEVRFQIELNKQGSATEYAWLNEDQATLLLTYMRNSDVVRAFKKRLVKDFRLMKEALNNQPLAQAFFLPKNYLEALECLVVAEKEKLALASQVEEMLPAVSAFERLMDASGTFCFREAAKQLQINPHHLREWLIDNKWIYKLEGARSWSAYQNRIDQGRMMHKTHVVTDDEGTERAYQQARLTTKGLATIARKMGIALSTANLLSNSSSSIH